MQTEDFFRAGPELDHVIVAIEPPEHSLEILEKLGPSPFERGGFPLIGFLATTYEKVTRFALGGSTKDTVQMPQDPPAHDSPILR